MTERLDARSFKRWRSDPLAFIDEVLVYYDELTGARGKLLPSERDFLQWAFKTGDDGRLLFPELIYSCPKKSGKTTLAGIFVITLLVLYGGRYGEAILAANDYEQSRARVFEMIKRIIEASPLLRGASNITQTKITLDGATITAVPNDFASAAGANQNIAVFDELWAFSSERARRLFDELVPPPTKQIACRLTVTYAGFSGEGELLEELYERGIKQQQVAPNLYAGDGMLCFWSHGPVAPWQTETWLKDMKRSLRPSQYMRMIENRFVRSESTFIDIELFNQVEDRLLGHRVADKSLICWAGVDASWKHDSTALALFTWDAQNQRVVLCDHHIFIPSSEQPIDFNIAVEQVVLDWHNRFSLQAVWFDPMQMIATAQSLQRQGVSMVEFPQTVPNLTRMAENLHGLIKGRNILFYRDAEIRTAISQSIAEEKGRGWKITKEKQSHRIDIVIAIGMAALAAVTAQENAYDFSMKWVDGVGLTGGTAEVADQQNRAVPMLQSFAQGMIARANYGFLSDRKLNGSLFGPDPRLNGALYGPSRSPFRRGW